MAERGGVKDDFEREVAAEIRRAEEKLGAGAARDWTDYQAAVAQIAAYRRCAKLFAGIYREYLTDDDDDR